MICLEHENSDRSTAAFIVGTVGVTLCLQWPDGAQTYATAVGEQRTMVLPDQSRMELNTDTEARVGYRSSVRNIKIRRGEATFLAVHDSRRSFEVNTSHGTTCTLGTKFNVLTHPAATTVAVLSGKVEVIPNVNGSAAAQPVTLLRGTQITRSDSGFSQVTSAELNP